MFSVGVPVLITVNMIWLTVALFPTNYRIFWREPLSNNEHQQTESLKGLRPNVSAVLDVVITVPCGILTFQDVPVIPQYKYVGPRGPQLSKEQEVSRFLDVAAASKPRFVMIMTLGLSASW